MDRKDQPYTVNLLKPKNGRMYEEVLIIFTALCGWAAMTFGFQVFVWFLSQAPQQQSVLTRFHFFNLPFHFWFTAQFLPLWFIIICAIFNLYTDRLNERHSRRRDRTYE